MAKHTFHTAGLLKYVWPFYNIMHERVKTNQMKDRRQISFLILCDFEWIN